MPLISHVKSYLLLFFAKKKSTKFDIKKTKKILFLRYDRIGDMIITTPVFRELKRKYPKIKITVLASKTNQDVLLNNPYIDEIIVNSKNNLIGDLPSLFKLKKQNFDVCVEFDHSVVPHAIFRVRIINAKINISIKKDGRYGVSGDELNLYDIYTEKHKKMHFRDIWLGLLEPFDIVPKSNNYDLFVTEEQDRKARFFLSKYKTKFLVGINLEGAIKEKKISFSELNQICLGLNAYDNNMHIFILTTPNKFQVISQKVKKMDFINVEMSYKTETILDVSALISRLNLVITPDTSVAHVASVYNKPVVTIHENNLDSYQLFAPTSTLQRTVFSKSREGLNGFSSNLLIKFCIELIDQIKETD